MKKMPPIEKIHEAYSAIADQRVSLEENSASVLSSDRSKKYTVTWKDGIYTSNDNASYWQGYAGYPIIAVLMLQGKLPLDRSVADNFKGINWNAHNSKHKSKYEKAVSEIMDDLRAKGVDCDKIDAEVEKVYRKLEELDVHCRRSSLKPPAKVKEV
jgi:hypothetical protein